MIHTKNELYQTEPLPHETNLKMHPNDVTVVKWCPQTCFSIPRPFNTIQSNQQDICR